MQPEIGKQKSYFNDLGFKKTIELKLNTYFRIDQTLKILCNPIYHKVTFCLIDYIFVIIYIYLKG